jgi:hypothetical protein
MFWRGKFPIGKLHFPSVKSSYFPSPRVGQQDPASLMFTIFMVAEAMQSG